MGVLTRGTNYSSGSTVTAANLESLITAATLAGLTRTHIDQSTISLASRRNDNPPGPYIGEVKIKISSNETLLVYNGSSFVPCQHNVTLCQVAPASSVEQFDGLRFGRVSGSTFLVALARESEPNNLFGVTYDSGSSGEDILVVTSGEKVTLNVVGAVSVGDGLKVSSTNGKFISVGKRTGADVLAIARTSSPGSGTVSAWLIR